MSRGRTVASIGISCISIFTLIFIALKLLGKISWSWWWVISPFWISACILIVAVLSAIVHMYCVGDVNIIDRK